MPTYKMFVMDGKQPTKIDSAEKNYEVREFLGNIVSRDQGTVVSQDLTIAEAHQLINKLNATPPEPETTDEEK